MNGLLERLESKQRAAHLRVAYSKRDSSVDVRSFGSLLIREKERGHSLLGTHVSIVQRINWQFILARDLSG